MNPDYTAQILRATCVCKLNDVIDYLFHYLSIIYYVIFTQEYPISAQHCSPWDSC